MFSNSKNINNIHIAFLLFMLILSYPIQVITGTLLFSKLFYIWVAVLAVYFTLKSISKKEIYKSDTDKTFFYSFGIYLSVVILGAFQEFLYTGSFLDFIRLMLLYFFPLILVYHALKLKGLSIVFILNVLLFVSIVISIESIYEFLLWKGVTFYEMANYEYVKKLTGRELSQLLGPLRHTGLLDHLHITGMFIGFGVASAVIFYYETKKNIYLAVLFVVSMAFIANGTRLMILSVTFFLLLYALKRDKIDYMRLLKIIMTVVFAFILLYSISSDNKYFWFSIYFQYLPDALNHYLFTDADIKYIKEVASTQDSVGAMGRAIERDIFIDSPILTSKSDGLFVLLVGVGFGTYVSYLDLGTDDVFILQLFNHLGIVGSVALISLLFLSYRRGILLIKKKDFLDKMIIWISLAFIFMMSVSLLHSGVFIRKSMYTLFFLFILIINSSYWSAFHKNSKSG